MVLSKSDLDVLQRASVMKFLTDEYFVDWVWDCFVLNKNNQQHHVGKKFLMDCSRWFAIYTALV